MTYRYRANAPQTFFLATAFALVFSTGSAFAQAPAGTPPATTAPPAADAPKAPLTLPPLDPANNRFLPPDAHIFYAPDRDYDLQHVAVTLTVNYPARSISGEVVNTIAPLRVDGLSEIKFDCGEHLTVDSVSIDGKSATYRRMGDKIFVTALEKSRRGARPRFVSCIAARISRERVSRAARADCTGSIRRRHCLTASVSGPGRDRRQPALGADLGLSQ